MDHQHLSGSQRAYLFRRDQFLAGIRERAGTLFQDGYDVEPTREPHVFRVFCPEKKGTRPAYLVDPVSATCTCPFYSRQGMEPLTDDGTRVLCKHLVGLTGLVHAQCRNHVKGHRLGRYYRLFVQWRKASALCPDLDAEWQALGPVFVNVPTGTCSPRGGLSPRKDTQPCAGMTSPIG